MKRYMIFLLAIVSFMAFVACDPVKENPPQFKVQQKTVLVYMVANNNLSSQAESNLSAMKQGYVPSEDNLLVYMHLQNAAPAMLKVYKDERGAIVQDTVYKFPAWNSADPVSLTSVLKVTRTMFPAEEYGLVLWSHGTGWLPEGYYTKSFGSDAGKEMDIKDLAKALPYKMDFVIFDACLMGGVEVAYELKDSVNYIISSPAEILSQGFPYSRIMKHIYAPDGKLQNVAREYYEFYNGKSGSMKSATISMVDCSALDKLAEETAALYSKYKSNAGNVDTLEVQRYYRGSKHWFYDLGNYMHELSGGDDEAFKAALDKAVVYKAATENFLEISIDQEKYSGISTYIPSPTADPQLVEYYSNFKWSKATGYPVLQSSGE